MRCLSSHTLANNHNRTNVNVLKKKFCLIPLSSFAIQTQPQICQMSSSIADEIIMKNKQEQEDKKKTNLEGGESDGGAKGDGEKNKDDKPKSKWEKFKSWGPYIFLGVFTVSMTGQGILFSLPDKDENGHDIIDEYSSLPFPSQYYNRLKDKIWTTKKTIEDPFSDRLLPDPLEEPYIQPKYTICLELTGLLVHSSWTHKYGWRFQKRPGVDIFLSQIGYPNFELVVYTIENGMTFFPIIDGLDPNNQYINYRLFRDATRFVNGHPTKDVNSLNRDPKRVIFIDWNKDSVALGRDNALILQKWEGDNTDTNLIGLSQLLQTIRETDVDDVRDVLTYYRQFDDPIAVFRENQRKLQEEMNVMEEKRKEIQTKSSFGSGFTGLSFMRRR